ncbi:PP2C family protein-serine/threonine phosphatase [Streptomyces albus]|uniref:PP2C family protein-serine/threonine phosphatase n=1 Tax=Streptomyces albus TaxID=1888 RepID=UPI000A400888|nr:PP2C family protein-serine/threonine phosphatase [Streptomyces albus]
MERFVESAAAAGGAGLGAAWRAAPYPVIAVGADGVVRSVSDVAAELCPAIRPGARLREAAPAWLAEAHDRFTGGGLRENGPGTGRQQARRREGAAGGGAAGRIGERIVTAHPSAHPGGTVLWWLVDDTGRRAADEALREEREHTESMAEAATMLLASLNPERCVEVTARLAAEHFADAALVLVPGPGRLLPVVACEHGGRPVRHPALADPAGMPGLTEALRGAPLPPPRWVAPQDTPAWAVPPGFGPVGSTVVKTLPGPLEKPAGALVLLLRPGRERFTEREELFLRLFSSRAGAAISAARLYADQAAITETLMRELLPPVLHRTGGVEFAGGYRASSDSEQVGGDFYDVHPLPDGAGGEGFLVALGDVCGKGLEAAVLAGKIRITLEALLPLAGDHQEVLSLLNGALLNSPQHTRFATLVLTTAVRRGGGLELRMTSAGHPAPLIVRAGGRVEEAATSGTLVGALPEVETVTARTTLAPGETCVLFTDGITEARGGPLGREMFGDERLRQTLSECAELPPEAVVERVLMLAAEWAGPGPSDDMAVVAIAPPGGGPHGGGPHAGRAGAGGHRLERGTS